MQLNLTVEQNAYKQACISLHTKGDELKWNAAKYFLELIFMTIKHKQSQLKLNKIPKDFLSTLNFLRQAELIVVEEQHLSCRIEIKEGYDAYIHFKNDCTILEYEWSLLNEQFLCIDGSIITALYEKYKKQKNVIVYGIKINPRKTDIFNGYIPSLENITQNINNSNFKQYDRINQISGVFVIDKIIKKNKNIILLPKHVVFKTIKRNQNDINDNYDNYGNKSILLESTNDDFLGNTDNKRMDNDDNKTCLNDDDRLFMDKIGIDSNLLNNKYDEKKLDALEHKIRCIERENKIDMTRKNKLEHRILLLESALNTMGSSNSNKNQK